MKLDMGSAPGVALLDALFDRAPVGLAFWDEELRCVRVNGALAAMAGVRADAMVGRTPSEILPDIGQRLERLLRAPRSEAEVTGRLPGDPGARTWVASTFPISGGRARFGSILTDVTQRKRVEKERRRLLLAAREAQDRAEQAEKRFEFLAAAGKLLVSSLDHGETLRTIADLAVPALADWCFVELLQDDGSIKRVAWAAANPQHAAVMAHYDERYPLDPEAPFGSPQVIRTGEPLMIERIPEEQMLAIAQDAEHVEVLKRLEFGAVIIVPLRARGRILGDIALTAGPARGFDADDLALAQELADRCALAVDNARLYSERGH